MSNGSHWTTGKIVPAFQRVREKVKKSKSPFIITKKKGMTKNEKKKK